MFPPMKVENIEENSRERVDWTRMFNKFLYNFELQSPYFTPRRVIHPPSRGSETARREDNVVVLLSRGSELLSQRDWAT